MSHTIISPI